MLAAAAAVAGVLFCQRSKRVITNSREKLAAIHSKKEKN
jgi:hypothetical protein